MPKKRKNYENSAFYRLKMWVQSYNEPFERPIPMKNAPQTSPQVKTELPSAQRLMETAEARSFKVAYRIASVIVCLTLIGLLLITISYLPRYGDPDNPHNTEVSERYIESGLKETGAVNITAGMILDYRAFDTFGESCVLFSAVTCVFILMRLDIGESRETDRKRLEADLDDRRFEPKNDPILRAAANLIVPLMLLFGVYVILNGHISPGGGFSGGAVVGSALILYLLAFGFRRTEKLFNEKTFKVLTVSALSFYCLSKCYSFFTGANSLESHIPLGTPGAILSAGLILPLDICVGIVVACTMYAFYVMFRKNNF